MKIIEETNSYVKWEDGSHTRIKNMEDATEIAGLLTEQTGKTYIPVDRGRYTYPQFSTIQIPEVGDEVSMGFNGDSYPSGKIIKISKSLRRIETDSGKVFWRKNSTGTWSMIKGIHNNMNPHI